MAILAWLLGRVPLESAGEPLGRACASPSGSPWVPIPAPTPRASRSTETRHADPRVRHPRARPAPRGLRLLHPGAVPRRHRLLPLPDLPRARRPGPSGSSSPSTSCSSRNEEAALAARLPARGQPRRGTEQPPGGGRWGALHAAGPLASSSASREARSAEPFAGRSRVARWRAAPDGPDMAAAAAPSGPADDSVASPAAPRTGSSRGRSPDASCAVPHAIRGCGPGSPGPDRGPRHVTWGRFAAPARSVAQVRSLDPRPLCGTMLDLRQAARGGLRYPGRAPAPTEIGDSPPPPLGHRAPDASWSASTRSAAPPESTTDRCR